MNSKSIATIVIAIIIVSIEIPKATTGIECAAILGIGVWLVLFGWMCKD